MAKIFYNSITPDEDEEFNKKNERKAKAANEIAIKSLQTPYLKGVVDMIMIDFSKNCFFEKKIDSLGNLFAFSNKVLDCRTKEIDEEAKTIIEDYYTTIYPDPDVCAYMWNNDSLTLNGERIFQTFNIHTGSGCNSKSTKIAMLKKVLGDYFIEVNPETFTKAAKGANATSELYLAKGRRMVFFNEPESDVDNKLQTRGLYKDAVEFPIFFRLEGACNNKPVLSSVDGGIGRRVRIVDYPTKFVENPDPTNKYQAKLDNEFVNDITTDTIRDTYIRLLIDHFINTSSISKTENVPKKIVDDSNEYIAVSNIVLGFIMDNYKITGNDTDKIPSSEIFNDFKNYTKDKMTQSKFKDDMLGIGGINHGRDKKR
ncbi:hypothetical protein T492DRAFT_850437 [Pavlovales sp. CCMP2436]|nr:hypothetical protein T492DRAFT_850437 [Pavlovales sp. CCMP2436]